MECDVVPGTDVAKWIDVDTTEEVRRCFCVVPQTHFCFHPSRGFASIRL